MFCALPSLPLVKGAGVGPGVSGLGDTVTFTSTGQNPQYRKLPGVRERQRARERGRERETEKQTDRNRERHRERQRERERSFHQTWLLFAITEEL